MVTQVASGSDNWSETNYYDSTQNGQVIGCFSDLTKGDNPSLSCQNIGENKIEQLCAARFSTPSPWTRTYSFTEKNELANCMKKESAESPVFTWVEDHEVFKKIASNLSGKEDISEAVIQRSISHEIQKKIDRRVTGPLTQELTRVAKKCSVESKALKGQQTFSFPAANELKECLDKGSDQAYANEDIHSLSSMYFSDETDLSEEEIRIKVFKIVNASHIDSVRICGCDSSNDPRPLEEIASPYVEKIQQCSIEGQQRQKEWDRIVNIHIKTSMGLTHF